MANTVKLRDVAELAGVSIGTASQALNNRPSVASETRSRVLDAARSLGYPFREPVDDFDDVSIEVIGMLTKHEVGEAPGVNPFYSYIQAGVESECRKRQISLMYSQIEVDPSNRPVAWPPMVSEQRVDGLLLLGTLLEDTVELLRRRADSPIVLVDSYAPTLSYDSILIDNVPAAITAVEHLIEHGHRHIGLVGTNPRSPRSLWERREGYLKALEQHNISDVYIEDSQLDGQAGYQATLSLLRRAPHITALFCGTDLCATGALRAARDLGRRVPDDLSIIGFDNIDLSGALTPPLTTIHVHKTWMGVLGVRQLLQRAQTPEQPKTTILVGTQLVVRESVKAIST